MSYFIGENRWQCVKCGCSWLTKEGADSCDCRGGKKMKFDDKFKNRLVENCEILFNDDTIGELKINNKKYLVLPNNNFDKFRNAVLKTIKDVLGEAE